MTRTDIAITLVVVLIAAGIGYAVITSVASSDEMQEYMTNAETWCNEENGTLYSSHTLGDHSGLHCGMGDTVVHMDTVAELNWTHNISKVKAHDNPSVFPSLEGIGVTLGIALLVVVSAYLYGIWWN